MSGNQVYEYNKYLKFDALYESKRSDVSIKTICLKHFVWYFRSMQALHVETFKH
jgi:hypothetical protein